MVSTGSLDLMISPRSRSARVRSPLRTAAATAWDMLFASNPNCYDVLSVKTCLPVSMDWKWLEVPKRKMTLSFLSFGVLQIVPPLLPRSTPGILRRRVRRICGVRAGHLRLGLQGSFAITSNPLGQTAICCLPQQFVRGRCSQLRAVYKKDIISISTICIIKGQNPSKLCNCCHVSVDHLPGVLGTVFASIVFEGCLAWHGKAAAYGTCKHLHRPVE